MSDKKISQLTAATTPLAGTEVLPIVQSSTTVKASIANIQAAPVAAGLANGVQYLNASKVPSTIANFTYDTSKLTILDQLLVSTSQTKFGDNGKISGGAADANTALSYFGGKDFFIKEGASTRVTVAAGGDVTLATGNLVIGTAGKGIDFSADPSPAGMTSELLDDYEEGTWTPVLTFGGATTAITYATQFGQYTKIGRQVTLICRVVLTSKGSATGLASITGLPFNAATNINSMTVVDPASSFNGIIVGGATLLSVASNELYFLQQSLTDRTTMSETNFGNTADFRFVIVYTV